MEILSALLGAMMIFGLVTLFCLSRTLWRREPAAEGQEDCLPALPWQDPELLLFTVLSGAAWICACVMHTVPVMTAVSDLILISGMTVLAYIDRRHHIVPNRLLLALLVLWLSVCGIGVIFDPETGIGYVLSGIAGAVIAGAAFLLCYLLSARQLGGGDVKLSEVMG
ncbi:MAG: prepilin peptidase, partial [Clostridia bacterium]|nr:prepilin peptidase [Clostridia bacterium]